MAQRLVFIPDRSYTTQASLNTQLDTLHAANPISLLSTHGNSQPDVWARVWAQGKGVPWIDRGNYMDGAGYVAPNERALANMLLTKPDAVLTAGTGAHPVAAVAAATKRGHTLTQL